MPNIKAGNRVYRNVEKMDTNSLHEVRVALIMEQQRITTQAQTLMNARGGSGQVGKLQEQMTQLERRIGIVDGFAKAIFKKAIPEVPKHYLEPDSTNG
jgi:hypothetical protein